MNRSRAIGLAALMAATAVSCSLLTSLDAPRDGSNRSSDASSDAASDAGPVILVDLGADAGITGLYVDSRTSNVFLTASSLGDVYEIPSDGAAVPLITQLARPDRITGRSSVSSGSVVYVAAFAGNTGRRGIFRLTDDGGVTSPLGDGGLVADDASFPLHPFGLALSPSTRETLFWTNCLDPSATTGCNSADSQVVETDVLAGLSKVRATLPATFARDIVVTDELVLWDTFAAALYAQPLDGGAPQVLEGNCAGIIYFAAAPQGNPVPPRIYFTSAASCGSTSTIWYRDVSNLGSAKQTFATDLVNGVFSMTSDGTYLYWANHGDGTIVRKAVAGSSPAEIVVTSPAAAGPPKQLVASHGVLYWTTESSVVRFTPRP